MRALLVLVTACGSTSPATTTSTGGETESNETRSNETQSNETNESLAGCPATWADAPTQTVDCEQPEPPTCDYPEGRCACLLPETECSGVQREPGPLALVPTWRCEGHVRPDGCPREAPTGAACTDEGRSCTYGRCGGAIVTCQDGAWTTTGFVSPPP